MPKFKHPETASIIVNRTTGALLDPPFPFAMFVSNKLLSDQAFGNDMAGIYAGIEVRKAIEASAPGGTFTLTADQAERLRRTAKAPTGGYAFELMSQCPEYLQAIDSPLEQ